jgi:hypothetical protein
MDEQGSEWVSFIAKELEREYDRRDELNRRSSSAKISATTLVTVSNDRNLWMSLGEAVR